MAKSKVTITIVGPPPQGYGISIRNSLIADTGGPPGTITETYTTTRYAPYLVTTDVDLARCAAFLYQALRLDYTSSSLVTYWQDGPTVIIEATLSNAVFTDLGHGGPDPSWRTVVISNVTEEPPISISSATFTKDVSDICGGVITNVATNVLAVSYTLNGGAPIANSVNPFTYRDLRGTATTLEVTAANGTKASLRVLSPEELFVGNVNLTIYNSPGGGNVKVNVFLIGGLTLEYSLDTVTWVTSSTFSGLAPGNYTVYIRDQFGCMIFKNFAIPIFGPNTKSGCPVSYISESMSIRFKHNEVWDYNDVYKTDANTLSCEENTIQAFQYRQLFKPTNVVRTQLLSNYDLIAASVIREDGTKVVIPVERLVKFMDLKDKRDARVRSYGDTYSAVYYPGGSTYDYDTVQVNGSYTANDPMPPYSSVGNYIEVLGAGWFLIESILYDPELNRDVLVISYKAPQQDYAVIVGSNWNQKNYNVYEFKIDFALYVNEYIQVEVLQSSPAYGQYNYLSEILEISKYFKDTVELIWYNHEDSNVFYSTGIKNIGNFYLDSFTSGNSGEVVINKTTNSSIMVNASNYDTKELVLDELSTCIMKQVSQAVMHKKLMVDRVHYISESMPAVENVKATNLYKLTAQLVQTNPPYLACKPSGVQTSQASQQLPTFNGNSPN